jgi:integrase
VVTLPKLGHPGRSTQVGTYESEADARDAEFQEQKKRREGRAAPNRGKMTVADACRAYMASCGAKRDAKALADGTYVAYRSMAANVTEPLASVRLRDLRKSHIQAWIWDRATKRRPSNIGKYRTFLRMALEYAADDERGWIAPGEVTTLFRKLDMPKGTPRRPHIEQEDADLFMATVREYYPKYELPFLILFTTGMRKGELLALSWESVSWPKREFTVSKSYSQYGGIKGTKSGKTRYNVEIAGEVERLLRLRWEEAGRPSSGTIFPGPQGCAAMLGGLDRAFIGAMNTANLKVRDEQGRWVHKFTIHSCRRYYADAMKKALGLYVASESIGHADTRMTVLYCRGGGENASRRAEVERLDAMLKPKLLLPSPDTTKNTT